MIEENDDKTLDLFQDETAFTYTSGGGCTGTMGPIGCASTSSYPFDPSTVFTTTLSSPNVYTNLTYPYLSIGGGGGTAGIGGYAGITESYSQNQLRVIGDAEVEGDLKIKGVSLSDRLDRIEERLAILRLNEDLEEKWEELRALGQKYRELEADIKEKEQIWATLKK